VPTEPEPCYSRHRAWIGWLVAIVILTGIIGSSGSYHTCIHEHKGDSEYRLLNDPRGSLAARKLTKARLVGACTVSFADENENAITALAGVALALFTLYLWLATKGLRRYAGIQARDMQQLLTAAKANATAAADQATAMDRLRLAAEAQERALTTTAEATRQSADIARRALTVLERPYIVVEVIEPGIQVGINGQFSFVGSQPKWEAMNVGRSPALLLDRRTVWKVEADGTLPYAIDPIRERGPRFPEGCIVTAMRSFSETHNYMADLPKYQEMLDSDAWQKWRIYFTGYVRYCDLLGGIYVNGFCLIFDHLGQRFVRIGPESHNYTSTEMEPGRSTLTNIKDEKAAPKEN
jgi:hypothetical protein